MASTTVDTSVYLYILYNVHCSKCFLFRSSSPFFFSVATLQCYSTLSSVIVPSNVAVAHPSESHNTSESLNQKHHELAHSRSEQCRTWKKKNWTINFHTFFWFCFCHSLWPPAPSPPTPPLICFMPFIYLDFFLFSNLFPSYCVSDAIFFSLVLSYSFHSLSFYFPTQSGPFHSNHSYQLQPLYFIH